MSQKKKSEYHQPFFQIVNKVAWKKGGGGRGSGGVEEGGEDRKYFFGIGIGRMDLILKESAFCLRD